MQKEEGRGEKNGNRGGRVIAYKMCNRDSEEACLLNLFLSEQDANSKISYCAKSELTSSFILDYYFTHLSNFMEEFFFCQEFLNNII